MAGMSTTLTELNDKDNEREYITSGHTAAKPKMVLQRRRKPVGANGVAEDTVSTLHATTDADGAILPQKVLISTTIRRPIQGQSADVDAALVIHRDIVASDEFTEVKNTQQYLE